MALLIQVIVESLALFLAILLGFLCLKYMSLFFKIVFVQLLVYISFYIAGHLITLWQIKNGLSENNVAVMNLHLTIETSFLICAAMVYFKRGWERTLAISLWILFIMINI